MAAILKLRKERPMQPKPKLDAKAFDAIVKRPEKLWGLAAIAGVIGLSVDATRRVAATGKAPIYRPEGSGRWFALRSELNAWLRSRTDAT